MLMVSSINLLIFQNLRLFKTKMLNLTNYFLPILVKQYILGVLLSSKLREDEHTHHQSTLPASHHEHQHHQSTLPASHHEKRKRNSSRETSLESLLEATEHLYLLISFYIYIYLHLSLSICQSLYLSLPRETQTELLP